MDRRLRNAVDASRQWYDDVFAVHGIPTRLADGLWCAKGEPPRWHSAAKTLDPTVPGDRVLLAVEQFERCSVADSFGPRICPTAVSSRSSPPPGYINRQCRCAPTCCCRRCWRIRDSPSWHGMRTADSPGRAVLHDCQGEAVGLSNARALPGASLAVAALGACAGTVHPGRALVDYVRGDNLDALVEGGFSRLGPQVVWVR